MRYRVTLCVNGRVVVRDRFPTVETARWFKDHCIVNPAAYIVDMLTGEIIK